MILRLMILRLMILRLMIYQLETRPFIIRETAARDQQQQLSLTASSLP